MRGPEENAGIHAAIRVRPMSAPDCSAAHAILTESPEASMWSLGGLREAVSAGNCWTAEVDGRVAGILMGRPAADEFEILNLAVGKAWRRRGVGTRLMRAALQQARDAGARQAYLEVRASNQSAIALYERAGFRVCGRRANYYSHPADDAVLLVLQIPE